MFDNHNHKFNSCFEYHQQKGTIRSLFEQHRIVAKVDELFALGDALKERIKEAQQTQGMLAEVVVEGVLG